jgi:putative photosynthetic complex assembly protein 2
VSAQTAYVLPLLYALLVWWLSTGVILYLGRLARPTYRWSMLGASALLLGALYGLAATAGQATAAGAWWAFSCAIAVWAWLEMSFLLGYITGPHRRPCVPGCSEPARFGHAVQTIWHHELAVVAAAAVIFAVTWEEPNRIGAWTFLILWIMRLSAKLNLFLGVRNWSEDFLPPHLHHLQSYFHRRTGNLLLPVSILASTCAAFLLASFSLSHDPGSHEQVGYGLLASLLALAVLEHWLMVLPLSPTALWKWVGAGASQPAQSAAVRMPGSPGSGTA